jgi:DNA invertase Pin-like site-specific DNA recombinase
MLIGYARVSTHDQNLNLQRDALTQAGCDRIFEDTTSGARAERPGLDRMKEQLRSGDTLVVWRLDRLGRTLRNLIEWVTWLESEGIAFKSLQESIDTTTSGGKLIFHMFGALAEFERNLIRERTNAGLLSARARGRLGGRPPALDEKKQKLLIKAYHDKDHSITEILEMFSISKSTLYKIIRENPSEKKAS